MKKTLNIAKGFSLPIEAMTQSVTIVAKKRVGKSYTMRKVSEEILECGQQLVLVDPKGDQWGIRSSADGKKPGYPVLILGGEHGDLPLEKQSGELVAKLVVEQQVSIVLDLSAFRKYEIAIFMQDFLENLYRLKAQEKYRTPVTVVIDEADAIAPQSPQKGEERMLGAADDLVRRGGQRGIGVWLVTQRSAVLNKNVMTQSQILVVLRTIAPQDLKAITAWIDVHGTPEQRKVLMESLPSLPIGDAWFWSPGWPTEEGIFKRVHIAPIRTFDSAKTPGIGERRIIPKNLADVDLAALKGEMAATIEKAKKDDPKELHKKIAQLSADLAKRAIPVTKGAHSSDDLKKEYRRGFEAGEVEGVQRGLAGAAKAHKAIMEKIARNLSKAQGEISVAITSTGEDAKITVTRAAGIRVTPPDVRQPAARPAPSHLIVEKKDKQTISNLTEGLSKPEQTILDAIRWLNAIGQENPSKTAVALIAKVRPTSGGYQNNLSKLRSGGWVDYLTPGCVSLTEEGKEIANVPNIDAINNGDFHRVILETLSNPEQAVLSPLLAAAGAEMTKEDLASRTVGPNGEPYSATSGGYQNTLSVLRSLGLLDYPRPGLVKATDLMFPFAV